MLVSKSLEQKKRKLRYVRTPARPFLKRSLNLIYEENFVSGIDKSIVALANHLGNKVDREAKLNTIKYDTIVEENHEEAILLGLNVSASNRKKEISSILW